MVGGFVRVLTVAHADGVAAIVRDGAGDHWLSARGSERERIDGFDWEWDAAGGTFVFGGLLPPGAVRVEVMDERGCVHVPTCGGGAWLLAAAEDQGLEIDAITFRDAAGAGGDPAAVGRGCGDAGHRRGRGLRLMRTSSMSSSERRRLRPPTLWSQT